MFYHNVHIEDLVSISIPHVFQLNDPKNQDVIFLYLHYLMFQIHVVNVRSPNSCVYSLRLGIVSTRLFFKFLILNQEFISSESILFPLDFTSYAREHRLHTSNIDSVSSSLIEYPSCRHNGHKLELLTLNNIQHYFIIIAYTFF